VELAPPKSPHSRVFSKRFIFLLGSEDELKPHRGTNKGVYSKVRMQFTEVALGSA